MKPEADRPRHRGRRPHWTGLVATILAAAAVPAQEERIDPGRIAAGIRVLREGLEEGPEEVRDCAWKALSRIEIPEARNLLEQSLQHPQREVRIAAARALRRRGDPAVLPILERELQAQVWSVREEALRDLARVGGPAAVPTLREILRAPRQPAAVRAAAADGLGILREGSAVPDLAAELASPSDVLRRHALLALGEIGSAEAIPRLREHLKDVRDPLETVLTVRALALAGDPEGTLRAEGLLISADPHHRRIARETLR
ncbi:MAG: HEAT repeat domain-containing protein, partial [Acidobacteria bacterium]|nr:HEAT repeat domain-containing protein [Acidobacteriota bacterium]